MSDRFDVVVVGAGQAGLAVSRELTKAGVAHVVLERGRVGETWRRRWDSFCLVTPNWSLQLPDHPYDGDDPDGFLPREDAVAYLERYAVEAPVEQGVEVASVEPRSADGFLVQTSSGTLAAKAVVLCTGAYQRPHRPAGAASLPADLLQIDVDDYRNPEELPAGAVLVVGSGQSGCQIAEELHEAGRDVFLSCGRAPWSPRRIGDHDLVWWLVESGELETTLDALPTPADRLLANVQASGRRGGHDLHYRTLRGMGVTLLGHFLGADGRRARFVADLGETVAWADQRYARFMNLIREVAVERGMPEAEIAEPEPFDNTAPDELSLDGLGAVVFAGGFRPDYSSWVHCPGAFDELGYPNHADGASTAAPGLYFVGVHYLRKRKSSLLIGVGEDAAIVADTIARRRSVGARAARL
jgi:cation diffusion facilitator CzcD-associated flavoprotein CzcO